LIGADLSVIAPRDSRKVQQMPRIPIRYFPTSSNVEAFQYFSKQKCKPHLLSRIRSTK